MLYGFRCDHDAQWQIYYHQCYPRILIHYSHLGSWQGILPKSQLKTAVIQCSNNGLIVSMSYLKTAVTPKVTTQDCGDSRSHHSLVLRHWPIELSSVTTSWTWAHMTGWCIQHNSDNGRQRWNFEHTKDYRYPISCTHRRVMGCTLWRLQRNWPVIRRLYCIYCIIQASCCVWSISPVRIAWTYLLLGNVVIIFRV